MTTSHLISINFLCVLMIMRTKSTVCTELILNSSGKLGGKYRILPSHRNLRIKQFWEIEKPECYNIRQENKSNLCNNRLM